MKVVEKLVIADAMKLHLVFIQLTQYFIPGKTNYISLFPVPRHIHDSALIMYKYG